jgi:hypothetical protein
MACAAPYRAMIPHVRSRTIVDVLTWAGVVWVVVFWRLGYRRDRVSFGADARYSRW